MRVTIIKNYGLDKINLPNMVFGEFWLTYKDHKSNIKNLVNVKAENGRWKIYSDNDTSIIFGNQVYPSTYLTNFNYFPLKIKETNEIVILYCEPFYKENLEVYKINSESFDLTIGSSNTCDIYLDNPLLQGKNITLQYKDSKWLLRNVEIPLYFFINNKVIESNELKYGDILFLAGSEIMLMKDFITVNFPKEKIKINSSLLKIINTPDLQYTASDIEEDLEMELYKEEDYYLGSPRLKLGIPEISINIDPPPAKEPENDKPLLYTIGPMLTMGLVSLVSGYNALQNLISKESTLLQSLPSLLVAFSMLASLILWPTLSRKYEKKQLQEREKNRTFKYLKYLENYKKYIEEKLDEQSKALYENYISCLESEDIINNRKIDLWKVKINSPDFLKLRIGIGNIPIFGNINLPEEHFTLDTDQMKNALVEVKQQFKELKNVPVITSFVEKNIVGIIGNKKISKQFVDGLILKSATQYSYDELKIILLTNEKNNDKWDYLKYAPHCWSNDRTIRFYGKTEDEYKEISSYLEQVINNRLSSETEDIDVGSLKDYHSYRSYYLIITDDYKSIKDLEIIKKVLSQNVNIGFSLVMLSEKIASLPKECINFIYVDEKKSGIFENELLDANQQIFQAELYNNTNLADLFIKLFNIPIEFDEIDFSLPKVINFLEMYKVGKVEQLNIQNRWKDSDPTASLQAPIGINNSGDLFKIDLHEKFHGPHGLIAGMTGSGKSELIITYILSMAINYSPEEVAFILIDYKGGGLAGVFNQPENNIVLPHLAGTITNLDTVEMNRALISIQSELRKRQAYFNEVRNKLNESTLDIYKYQRFYRENKVKIPIPHLFIICDEFAELKQQQPEYMDQLISTARIGRSLGLHLILSTQKPSGVVDDQIWSNSRLKICLKVQEKSDSIDVIKRPDAATLKNIGRFYMQVGYNDLFALGQSAYSGGKYIPSDKPKKNIDNSLIFVNKIGNNIKNIDNEKNNINIETEEEVTSILKYIIMIANMERVKADKLWLDRLPNEIFVDNLKEKYAYQSNKNIINPIVGEYDEPFNQKQHLLTLPLSKEGNAIIYGYAGSGKENLLKTIIYSSIIDHSPEEVAFYILDFGAESLKVFEQVPQVGNVVTVIENEKTMNLFKMLRETLENRKQLFQRFNGDFNLYNQKNSDPLPLIVVIINNYEAFNESYESLEDELVILTREGFKYGIVFILTTNGVSSIRYRIKQNFRKELSLQLTDQSDYVTIFGNTEGVYPSKVFGRGLVKFEKVYEFQSAMIAREDDFQEKVDNLTKQLINKYQAKVKTIPILPEKITYEVIKQEIRGLNSIPIGISKNSLDVVKYNFADNYITLITAQDIENTKDFVQALSKTLLKITNNLVIIGADDIFDDKFKKQKNYYDDNLDVIASKINDYAEQSIKLKQVAENDINELICIIVGIKNFFEKAKIDDINNFFNKINKSKNIKFILVDSIDIFKTYEYEDWYKSYINDNEGIYIGEGITDQYTIKITKNTRILQDDISNDYGYYVKRGSGILIKLLNFNEEDE